MLNIKVRVKHLVEKHGTANPFRIAAGLGLIVVYRPLPANIRGFLVRVLRRRYVVLNEDICEEAQRITLCHEIGHAILHTGYGYYLHPDSIYYIPSRREKEANEYAIHLLSYSSDFNASDVLRIITEREPNPREVHSILSRLIYINS